MKDYIKGNFRQSIFSSDNGYIIGIVKLKETNISELEYYINRSITITGYFYELNMNDTYLFYGNLVNHPKYGLQFNVSEYERMKPEDKDGIVSFLSSDLFKGVGEKLATQIVDVLGKDTLNKILEDKSNLLMVPKLSQKKIDTIYNTLVKYEESHSMIVYLTELGFSMKDALMIYNTYKKNTMIVLENNIYKLLDDITDISFLKIDEISSKLGMMFDDERRIKAVIIYIMKKISFETGNTYANKEEIYSQVYRYLKFEIDEASFDDYLSELANERKIVKKEYDYYLKDIYEAERNIVYTFTKLLNQPKEKIKNLDSKIKELEKNNNIFYNEKQKEAIEKSLKNHLFLITGGPGTGKTTLIKAIINIYQDIHKYTGEKLEEHLKLLAPTGRASKRMSESTLFPASTIHRFLRWNKENNSFSVNEKNKDKSTFFIIDETSMIDTLLLDSFLRGITDDVTLIFVGDFHQLPSVGAGQILKDMVESNKIEMVELKELYRQSENSYIPVLAKEIRENNLNNYQISKNDYQFLTCSKEVMIDSIKNICKKIIKKGYDYRTFQILVPMYKGPFGIDHFNQELQNIFNPKNKIKKELLVGDIIYREKDKILQLTNMPEENIFNGDIGIIEKIIESKYSESKKSEIYVNFDGHIVKYLPNDFHKIRHGFVISIHKSQGSEFDLVMLPICSPYKRMLYRKLIYTAITRAKKKLIIIGEEDAFVYSVNNNNENTRKTKLKEKLQKIRIK